jgi:hypothetical protein
LDLVPGDWVVVSEHFYDGWAFGVCLRTSFEGIFPLPVTIPRGGPNCKVITLNSCSDHTALFGSDILEGAAVAYPNQAVSKHCFTNNAGEQYLGTFYSRINRGILANVFESESWQLEDPDVKAIVCGPASFNGAVYDCLTDVGMKHESIKLLSADNIS